MLFLAVWLLLVGDLPAQKKGAFENTETYVFSNDQIELQVASQGGGFVSFTRKDDAKRTNPMWDPVGMAKRKGLPGAFGASKGHFLCVDGFGPVTRAERDAGYPGHGEANKMPWEVVQSTDGSATFKINLPIVQETLVRSVKVAPGESVVLVDSELESHLGFDRVMLWAEHATIGAPFLALGKTVVDASSTQCQTKPYRGAAGPQTFPSGVNFSWPKLDSPATDMRSSPAEHGTMNHIGCLMDPAKPLAFVTAYNSDERLMLGYLWPREDFPWIQHWMQYPNNGMYAWGLEFGMQPYDMTKQELVAMSPLFGAPTFRWLPAKSKVRAQFAMFLVKVPAGFQHAEDVRWEGGAIVLEDKTNSQRIRVPFAGGFRN